MWTLVKLRRLLNVPIEISGIALVCYGLIVCWMTGGTFVLLHDILHLSFPVAVMVSIVLLFLYKWLIFRLHHLLIG